MQLPTELTKDVINEKQLRCLFGNESSPGNDVVKQQSSLNTHNCSVQCSEGSGRSCRKQQFSKGGL